MASLRIEDYALIGDCVTAALVGRNGSIDWLCLPRFDSPSCFAALLGEPEHGRWLIAPADPKHRIERRYLDGSLVLATTFETSAGAVELIDFFRPRHGPLDLVRLVRGLRGRVAMCVELILRFDYGSMALSSMDAPCIASGSDELGRNVGLAVIYPALWRGR